MDEARKQAKKNNPDRVGALKFWAWQSRGVAGAANFIVLGFVSIYCTDALGISPALIGTLLMASKIVDAITDFLAGYLIDRTNSKWGKGRPYEWAIVATWLCTWIMFSAPGEASLAIKCIWVLSMYIMINAVCNTLAAASQNPYMIRAFATNGQRVKIASFGGIVIMVASIGINILFPIAMNRIATSPAGWSRAVALFAVPLTFIGMLRFFFVKETVEVEATSAPVKLRDIGTLFKNNPYIYIVGGMYLIYNMYVGMGIGTYFFTYVVGNVELMGLVSSAAIVVLPIMFFFPMMMKKIPKGKMVQIGCLFYVVGGLITFAAGGNVGWIIFATLFTGIGALPVTYLTDLMMIDCGSYNELRGYHRMDGTIGALKGFAGKVGSAFGSGIVGVFLSMAGYNGSSEVQTEAATFMIRALNGLLPAVLFLALAGLMFFYKIDKMQPEIDAFMEEATKKQ